MRRAPLAALGAAALAISMAPAFAGGNDKSGVTLHPNGFGEKSYAAWKGHEGEQDRVGNGDHALYFQKDTLTTTAAAGVAVFNGIEDLALPADGLYLAFDRRKDGTCGAGAPRYNVTVEYQGQRQTLFVGCAAMDRTDKNDRWETRSTTLSGIPGTVVGLAIVFDEGSEVPREPGVTSGKTWLDDIQVNNMLWTGPADNGQSNYVED
jgi:hypothetical protein